MMELRCPAKILHGVMVDTHTLEVKCRSARCGHRPGIVVLHRFDLSSGQVETLKFTDPSRRTIK